MNTESPKTITIDGTEHEVAKFSDKVKQLVAVHTKWRSEQMETRLELAKVEAAIRSIETELVQAVTDELAPKDAPTPATPTDAEAV